MERIKIVLLSGKQQAGKSTAAEFLRRYFNFTKLSFAGKLKEIAEELFPEKVNSPEEKRHLYIAIGNYMRSLDESVWANVVVKRITNLNFSFGSVNFVIDDWRFANEYEVLKKTFGEENILRIRLLRGKELRAKGEKFVEEAEEDISETALDNYEDFDAVIDNSADKASLYSNLVAALFSAGFFEEEEIR